MNCSLQSVHELTSGSLTIQANESKLNDLINISISLSFLRHSDGKLFERFLDDKEIQDLHQIFFDTTLILDILEKQPSSLKFICADTDIHPPLYAETKEATDATEAIEAVSCTEKTQNIKSENIDIIWTFTQARAHGLLKKSKDYLVSIRIPEKIYPPGSNQQIIELNRLLTCYKQRVDDLEMTWTTKYNLECGMIPIQNQTRQLTIEDMEWSSFSNYGKVTGLNKYYKQFKNSEDMAKQLYPKIPDDKLPSLHQYGGKLPPYVMYTDNSAQHIQNWLLENKLQFDEIKSAEFHLNKWTETSKYELVDVQIQSDVNRNDKMHKNIDHYGYSYNPSDFSHIVSGALNGYFRAANPRKKKMYVIARSTDSVPAKYEKAYYLKDAYKPIREYIESYPAISKIDEETEKHIVYNSQWIIYKICT